MAQAKSSIAINSWFAKWCKVIKRFSSLNNCSSLGILLFCSEVRIFLSRTGKEGTFKKLKERVSTSGREGENNLSSRLEPRSTFLANSFKVMFYTRCLEESKPSSMIDPWMFLSLGSDEICPPPQWYVILKVSINDWMICSPLPTFRCGIRTPFKGRVSHFFFLVLFDTV